MSSGERKSFAGSGIERDEQHDSGAQVRGDQTVLGVAQPADEPLAGHALHVDGDSVCDGAHGADPDGRTAGGRHAVGGCGQAGGVAEGCRQRDSDGGAGEEDER